MTPTTLSTYSLEDRGAQSLRSVQCLELVPRMLGVCLPHPRRNVRNLTEDSLQVQTSGWLVKELIVVLKEHMVHQQKLWGLRPH